MNVTVTIEASLRSAWEPVYEEVDPAASPESEVDEEDGKETQFMQEPEPTSFTRVLQLTNPSFRYSMLEGKKRVKENTGTLGVEPGDGWLEVPQEEQPKEEQPQEEDKEGGDVGGEPAAPEEPKDPPVDPKPGALHLKFSKAHSISLDEKGLIEFNDFPFMTLTLRDDAAEGATATLPGQSTYEVEVPEPIFDEEGNEIPPPDQPEPAVGRNFIFNDTFDLSAFMMSSEPIVHEFGNLDFQPDVSTYEGYPEAAPPPPGLRYLKVTLSVDNPLITGATLTKMNPMEVHVRNAKDLPGVRVTSINHQHYVEPSPFKLLEEYAYPPYCIVRALVADKSTYSRVTRTQSAPHRPNYNYDFRTCYLTGHLDRQLLHECVETMPVTVELQDRQPIPTKEELLADILRWEMLLAGGHMPPEEDNEEDARGNKKKDAGPSKPMDIYEIDELKLKEAHQGWVEAGDHCSHGISRCKVTHLLDQSAQLSTAYNKNNFDKKKGGEKLPPPPSPFIKERLDIQQEKRRRIPKGGLDEWQLNEGEVLIRKTGNYLSDSQVPLQHAEMHLNHRSTTTSVGVKVNLAEPLLSLTEGDAERTGPPDDIIFRPFTRAVYTFEYNNVKLLQSLNAAIAKVNEAALKDTMIGSLMSYQLTSEQVEATENATMNVLCGFTVLDDDSRMIFLEGTVEGIESVLHDVPRSQANDWSFRVLANPEVRFKERLYTGFNVDLKKVRLREPLPILNAMPELYNRAKVTEECFEALHRLGEIRHSNRMSEANVLQMFPTANMVTSIESKYGESISLEDILGVKPKKKIRSWMRKEEVAVVEEAVEMEKKRESVRLKGPTDDKNPEFDEYLKTRTPPDFLKEQEELLGLAKKEADAARDKRAELDAIEDPNRHVYSSQKLAYTEIKKQEMRDRLSREKNCTFTYSKDFTSQTVSMVDGERLKQVEEEENRSRWKTKRGFKYPAPRKASEYAVHPDKPSQSRIEILHEEWVENELHPENVKREIQLKLGQPDFDTVPSNGKMIFGGFEAPKYSRDYASSNIGSSTQLPRGKKTETRNPGFFNSVHLNGEEQADAERRIKEKEEQEWKDKIVVDSLDFLVGGFVQKEKPDQLDRASDILDGKALKTSLKIVRNARLPSGKRVPLRPAPYSAFSSEPYDDPKDFTADLRPNDATTYLTKDETGKGADFFRYIHHHTGKPKSQTFVAKRKVEPMTDAERFSGDPRW